ncbi:hypothetical protein Ais01nite_03080 [Asanoa ishikariensis]|uniref:Lipoprotein n=1 Tax=Asanoa ishikariensis TaxID=137265 RepID=A0A1H3TL36_9ACTN|nr:hypothetical protein [Asanoa ishikariensis]GIF62273.1 hypothetical protein Ais01nite_03080 [Asanoa ishikariensis]SDZ50578.1 hypothetical protein SAMN05421684_5923 [Asanoa ishikariensis]
MRERLRADYGAGLPHALLLLACFTIAGWVVFLVSGEATLWRMLLWFVGAAVAHDLVLFPTYAALDRLLRRTTGTDSAARRALLNHIRFPALAAGLLFLVFLPGILDLGKDTYQAATGQPRVSYFIRWLAVSGALFTLSGAVLAIRWALGRSPRHGAPPTTATPPR